MLLKEKAKNNANNNKSLKLCFPLRKAQSMHMSSRMWHFLTITSVDLQSS